MLSRSGLVAKPKELQARFSGQNELPVFTGLKPKIQNAKLEFISRFRRRILERLSLRN